MSWNSLVTALESSIDPSSSCSWAFSGSLSKNPSCSTLLSSSPIGFPSEVKELRSTASTPSSPFRPMSLNWLPSRVMAAAQVSILSSACGGKPLFLIAAASAARFAGGTRCASGGRFGVLKARLASAAISFCGFLLSTMVSTTSCCEPSIAWSNLAVRH